MPEGPEIYYASQYINQICEGKTFTGKVIKSEVSKCCEVSWDETNYFIHAQSRGKELKVTLESTNKSNSRELSILFHFGMSGFFKFNNLEEVPKHSHLRFFTTDTPSKVLSFVDTRRFGSWKVTEDWSFDRGPDPMFEYEDFRKNILENLDDSSFCKPICEVLLNQKFFNGIGNYLRAEILFRAGVPPFDEARSVLENIKIKEVKTENPDFLELCHLIPLEVTKLEGKSAAIYDPKSTKEDYSLFVAWLRCYNKSEMVNLKDHNKRTIWFQGQPGPLVPKAESKRVKKSSVKTVKLEKDLQSNELTSLKEKETSKNKKVKLENSLNKKIQLVKKELKHDMTVTSTGGRVLRKRK